MRYPVSITLDDNDTFLVRFPDVPGAVTYGDTEDEALSRAPDALLTVFDAYMKDRRDIPAPTKATARRFVELPVLEATKIELYRTMRAANVGKAELAKRLRWHLPQVDRVLKMKHASQLDQMEAAFAALGKRVVLSVVDAERVAENETSVRRNRGLRSQQRRSHAGTPRGTRKRRRSTSR
jgi:antitoxin HicB